MGPLLYRYGSDLHWLYGWGYRIDAMLSEDRQRTEYDGWVFRPDELADNAMMRYSIDYMAVVGELRAKLKQVEMTFEEWRLEPTEDNADSLSETMGILSQRIFTAARLIAERERIPIRKPISQLRARSRDIEFGELADILAEPEQCIERPEPTEKKIKPDASTVAIIRLLQKQKTTDEITSETGASAVNVRKIKSLFNSGKYEL